MPDPSESQSPKTPRDHRAAARAALGTIDYPEHLPVSARRGDLARAIADHPVVVVAGATGSGKTTQLPKIALDLGRGVAGQIGCTQPRRIAAASVAARVADELGCPLGSAVGYQVRFLGRHEPRTCVKFMTDGILLSEIRRDRLLSNYDTLIVDEAHERGLNVDFLLGYLRQLMPHRPDLRVVVSSATLDVQRFSEFFGGAPVVEVEGRTYPVSVRYRPPREEDDDPDYAEMTRAAVAEILRDEPEGDILAFFPGEADIRDAAEALDRARFPGVVILPLFARLSWEEQQRVFAPAGKFRKIILATNVAETSLTIPGIRAVVDCGRARIRRASEKASVERLLVEPISCASAEQRKGRCGRVGPGLCVRLYDEADFAKRPGYTDPEIRRASLAHVILQMKSLGIGELETFPFIDPPRPAMVAEGYRTLAELGALDAERRLTPIGRNLAHLPVEPRFGRMLLSARAEGMLDEALVIVAMLSVQDPRERPQDKRGEADAAHRPFLDAKSDFCGFLKLWNRYDEQLAALPNKSQARKWCRSQYLNYLRMTEWRDIHRQLSELLNHEPKMRVGDPAAAPAAEPESPRPEPRRPQGKKAAKAPAARQGGTPKDAAALPFRLNRPAADAPDSGGPPVLSPERYEKLHRALLAGLLGRIGKRSDDGDYLGSRGVRFHLWPGSGPATLARAKAGLPRPPRAGGPADAEGVGNSGKAAWVVCAELVETSRLFGRGVAEIDPAWVERAAGDLAKHRYASPYYDPRSGFVRALEKVTVHGLAVVENRRIHYGPINPAEARKIFIRDALVEAGLRNPPPFLKHNRAVVRDLEALEDKARAPLWNGPEAVYAFYDATLPPDIHNDRALADHAARLDRERDRRLYLTPDKLREHDPGGITPDRFPPHLSWRGAKYPLSYKFEPGATDDGVTVTVPAADLPALPSWRLEWLVPGLLGEKIANLLRGLPKGLRRDLVPIPDAVEAMIPLLPGPWAAAGAAREPDEPFPPALARAVLKYAGTRVPDDAWRVEELPSHLRMNVRVVDAAGRGLGQSRDVAALRKTLTGAAETMFASLARSAHERDNVTAWDFGDLKESVELSDPEHGGRAVAFPALTEEGGRVALRLCKTPAEAEEKTRNGLLRLFERVCEPQLKKLRSGLPLSRTTLMTAAADGYPPDDLRRDLMRLAIDRAWLDGQPFPRDATAFAKRIESGRLELAQSAYDAARAVDAAWVAALPLWAKLSNGPAALEESLSDMRRQLTAMLSPEGLRFATPDACREWPRYVAGVARRLERLPHNPPRDKQRLQTLRPYLDRWLGALSKADTLGYAARRALGSYRWLLEEWRIGLFAQELGTPRPASEKRLDECWRAFEVARNAEV